MEPHDIALLGRRPHHGDRQWRHPTHPDRGADELNLADMQPSLVYVDVATGDLLEEHRLAPELHQLSIRHLAIAADDIVGVRLPISRARGGCAGAGRLSPPRRDAGHRRGARHNASRACATISARSPPTEPACIVAASAPKGGLVTYWDVASRSYLGACGVERRLRPCAHPSQRELPADERRGLAGHCRGERRDVAPSFGFSMG